MRTLAVATVLALVGLGASAEPIYPTIGGSDFNFGAYNSDGQLEYATNGSQPDTLVFTPRGPGYDHEVTAWWPSWPNPPVFPVWDLGGIPNFGGDLIMGLMFTGQDAPYVGPGGTIDVSLTGLGFKVGSASADLEIWGTIYLGPSTVLQGLLWALDIEKASLYGYSDRSSYVLEALGLIVGGAVPQYLNLIGEQGAVRGHLDFIDQPAGWMPPLYDPAMDLNYRIRAGYSGETGWVPEPAALAMLASGVLLLGRR